MSRSARTAPAFPGESPLRLLHWLQLSPLDAAPPSAQLLSSPADNTGPRPVQHAATTLAAAGNADTRCQAPEASPPASGRKNVMLFLLHTEHNHTMHTSQLHASQLHAVDMRHARTDARTATVPLGHRALSQAWGAQDLVALCVIVPRTRCGDPSMTLTQSPWTTWGCRKHL